MLLLLYFYPGSCSCLLLMWWSAVDFCHIELVFSTFFVDTSSGHCLLHRYRFSPPGKCFETRDTVINAMFAKFNAVEGQHKCCMQKILRLILLISSPNLSGSVSTFPVKGSHLTGAGKALSLGFWKAAAIHHRPGEVSTLNKKKCTFCVSKFQLTCLFSSHDCSVPIR